MAKRSVPLKITQFSAVGRTERVAEALRGLVPLVLSLVSAVAAAAEPSSRVQVSPLQHVASAPESGPKQTASDPVLAQLITQSLAARPEIASARANVQAERERVTQAGAWPDPMLQIGMQNDGFTSIEVGRMPTSYYSIMASQTIPWPGKVGLRQEVLGSEAKLAEYAGERARLTTEADVRRAYLGLLLARDRLEILDRLDQVWNRSIGIARARYEAGQGIMSDVLRAQLELHRLHQRRVALQVEQRIRIQQLNRLRAHPLQEAIETTVHVRDLPLPNIDDDGLSLKVARERSPELSAARVRISQSGKNTALAKKSYYPDVTVSAGLMYRGTAMPPMWLVTVGAPIPVFSGSKQSRAVAENESRERASHFEADEIDQLLQLRVQERKATLAALRDTAHVFDTGLLEQSALTITNTLDQYVVGKVALTSVLDANAGYLNDEEGHLQVLAQAQLIEIAAREISLDPTVVSGGSAMSSGAASSAGAAGASMNSGESNPSSM